MYPTITITKYNSRNNTLKYFTLFTLLYNNIHFDLATCSTGKDCITICDNVVSGTHQSCKDCKV